MPLSATATQSATSTIPARITLSTPKRRISEPVKKPGANMPTTCHSITIATAPNGMLAEVHRDRRRRHQQVHEAVADGAGEHGDDEHGLAHDDRQRPPLARALLQRRRRNVHERLHDEREQRVAGEHDEAAEKRRREEIDRATRGFRPEKSADDAAGQHQRDRLRLVGRARRPPPLRSDTGGRSRCRRRSRPVATQ